ncbi:hypothetical protein CRUP_011925 [Coryphaenoides rupestris]|nr:hypothetical protein CRUP_011925 [Coryphaenoides rupestris]
MARCLKVFRFALCGPQRVNPRLLSSSRGLSCRTAASSFTTGADGRLGRSQPQQGLGPRPRLWGPQKPQPWYSQTSFYSTQEAEKAPDEEEPLHTIIDDTENVQGSASKHEFQAETKKLLDIVARSLYSEKEVVFIRELISNCSDALEKLRHKLITGGGDTAAMEIHLQTDSAKGTFTIQDTGVGMNQEELVANLGTIARSGSKAEASSSIIGQFGVGFYSAFMVADGVDVYSQTAEPGAPGYKWSSDGGTKIVLHLKDDCKEFSTEDRVKEVVTKYSNFVSFPIFLNGRRLNTLQKPSMFDVSREMGSSVALYSRKVLIQTKATEILPKWLRFLRGVVDSEDIPLNLSRELLQESALIRKLRDVLQQRVIRFLLDQSRKEPEKYAKFFEDYGLFMREGIVTTQEQDVREDIAKLLRFESSALPAGQQTNLMEYSTRMAAGTRNIYYMLGVVLFCYEQFDELTMLHLREFDKKKLISVETDIVVDHYKEEKYQDSKPASERLSEEQAEDLMAWMRNCLSTRVTNIKVTPRLDTHPAMITVLEMGAARHFLRTQQMARSTEERAQILQPTLEINAG